MDPGAITYSKLKTFLEQYQPTSCEHFSRRGATQDNNFFPEKKGMYVLYLLVLKEKGHD